ncbi:MAG: 50S ribosomal protein L21 [Bacteroidetes bacterium]|nr:50S ribosomal protein L21 [Bacteroidota bacterium]
MNAIVEIAGQQYEVAPNLKLNVPHLKGNSGDKISFNKIFLITDGENINVGTPTISGIVNATILEHGKDKKILVFHKKRRKGYKKLNGHRAVYTRIQIDSIDA